MGSHYAAALHYEKIQTFWCKSTSFKIQEKLKTLTDKAIILLPWQHMVALI
jgi:hypothetical protein